MTAPKPLSAENWAKFKDACGRRPKGLKFDDAKMECPAHFIDSIIAMVDEKDTTIAQAHAENAALVQALDDYGDEYRKGGGVVWREGGEYICGICNHRWHNAESFNVETHAKDCPLQLIKNLPAAGKALLDELTELRAFKERMRGIQFSPTGDNHHNALLCPHCNPEQIDPAKLKAEIERLRKNQRTPGTYEACDRCDRPVLEAGNCLSDPACPIRAGHP